MKLGISLHALTTTAALYVLYQLQLPPQYDPMWGQGCNQLLRDGESLEYDVDGSTAVSFYYYYLLLPGIYRAYFSDTCSRRLWHSGRPITVTDAPFSISATVFSAVYCDRNQPTTRMSLSSLNKSESNKHDQVWRLGETDGFRNLDWEWTICFEVIITEGGAMPLASLPVSVEAGDINF